MQALQGFRQLNTLAWRHLEESFEEMYPTIAEKRDALDDDDIFDDDFMFQATNNYEESNYNFYIWLGQNNIDTENIRAQFMLDLLSEVDEYFSNEFDNHITKFTPEHIINCWLYMFARTIKDELKNKFNELIYDADNNTDDENENENENEFEVLQ